MDEQLLIRFLSKKCTPEDTCQINDWIEADDANKEWLFEAERIWSLKDEIRFSDKHEIESAYNRFLSSWKKERKSSHSLRKYLKYAAAVLIAGILSFNIFYFMKKTAAEATFNVVEVPAGLRVSLILNDGTKVWLNSKSKLTYPVGFSKDNRSVQLEGEGYFEVQQDEKKSFIVITPFLEATVLGTKFNMKVYDEKAVVSLTEGKLRVNMKDYDQEVILHPNEKAVKQGAFLKVMSFSGEEDTIWKNGIIAFKETPLSEVLKTLSRHYNANFDSDGIDDEHIKITLKIMDEPLDVILEYIRLATDINYDIRKNDKEDAVLYDVNLSN
ncbi:MAG: FecR domain-containing protein [Tannerella sp.]|jgi:ferric-dicitrate binding protein FerR (iron transport regulator)|nr:FecR domain-containing protein [Tannerella sp.]